MSHHRTSRTFESDNGKNFDKSLDSGAIDSGYISGVLDSASNLDDEKNATSHGATANIPRVLSDLLESNFDDYCGKTYGEPSCLDSGVIPDSEAQVSSEIVDNDKAEEEAKGSGEQLQSLLEEAFAPDENGNTSLHQAIALVSSTMSMCVFVFAKRMFDLRTAGANVPKKSRGMRGCNGEYF
jgi:hypothetical protein